MAESGGEAYPPVELAELEDEYDPGPVSVIVTVGSAVLLLLLLTWP
jgi:hypothetical protein